MVTVARGMTAPLESFSVPMILPAWTGRGASRAPTRRHNRVRSRHGNPPMRGFICPTTKAGNLDEPCAMLDDWRLWRIKPQRRQCLDRRNEAAGWRDRSRRDPVIRSGRRLSRVHALQRADRSVGERCAGMCVLEPGSSPHPPHQHPEEEFMIVSSGTGEIFCAGKTTKVGPGAMMYRRQRHARYYEHRQSPADVLLVEVARQVTDQPGSGSTGQGCLIRCSVGPLTR